MFAEVYVEICACPQFHVIAGIGSVGKHSLYAMKSLLPVAEFVTSFALFCEDASSKQWPLDVHRRQSHCASDQAILEVPFQRP